MEQHCIEMMQRLNNQRRTEHFCDVILVVGSGDDQARLKAHRNVLCAASPFFYNALNSDMKEKKEGVIRLEQTSKAVMEEVLGYIYTGHVDFNEDNAYDLMVTADYLIIPCLKESLCKFLARTLSPSNCIMAYYSAATFLNCHHLQTQAREYIFANLMSVMTSEAFQRLDVEQVEEWISSDEIRVKSEEEVFQVIVKWMEGKKNRKDERFFQLFRHLRLPYLSRSYVFNVILPHPLVRISENCKAFVLDATKEIANGSEECFFAQPPRRCLKTREDSLVCCGRKKTFCYLPSENRWYEMCDKLSKITLNHCMIPCHGKLYISGGNGAVRTIERYDPSVNSWAPLKFNSAAITCRLTALVNFQGCLFVIGGVENGVTGNEATNSVQKYSPDTNLWQEVAPLSVARYGVCAVADRNCLYAIGGEVDNGSLDVVEQYDPERNSWSRIASTLERKMLSCGVIVSSKVFLFGGFVNRRPATPSSLIEMYDPATNAWSGIRNMAAPKLLCGAVRFKGEVFVIGLWGNDSSSNCSLKIYDVDTNEWKPCADAPSGIQLFTLAPLRVPRDILETCQVVQ